MRVWVLDLLNERSLHRKIAVVLGVMPTEKRCLRSNPLCLWSSKLIKSSFKIVQRAQMTPCNEMQEEAICPLILDVTLYLIFNLT